MDANELLNQEFANMPNGIPYKGFKELMQTRADEIIKKLKG